jgi:hypothetical protein
MNLESPPWDVPSRHQLTELEAYDAMRAFLKAYWERGLKSSDDIAVLLGSIQRGFPWADGSPADPAMWPDWLKAVDEVKNNV